MAAMGRPARKPRQGCLPNSSWRFAATTIACNIYNISTENIGHGSEQGCKDGEHRHQHAANGFQDSFQHVRSGGSQDDQDDGPASDKGRRHEVDQRDPEKKEDEDAKKERRGEAPREGI